MPKYSGAWTPDMGDGDESDSGSSPSSRRRDWRDEHDERKAQLAAWMKGKEPRQWWETYGMFGKFFCAEFPGTVHYFVVAWENLPEIGRLYVWCFGCKNGSCGACTWTRKAYVAELHEHTLKEGHAREDRLPF